MVAIGDVPVADLGESMQSRGASAPLLAPNNNIHKLQLRAPLSKLPLCTHVRLRES